jgi:carbonic anhydrase
MYFHVAEAQAYVLDRGSSRFLAVRPDGGTPVAVCAAGPAAALESGKGGAAEALEAI